MRSVRWNGFRSVLCGVDFSEHSRLALRHAAAVALRGHAALRVLHANDPLLVAAARAALGDRDVVARSARELAAFVEATLPAAFKRLQVSTRSVTGDAAGEILKAAARGRSDLIVLATHGLTGAERLVVGSTVLAVLHRTRVPVLAIPPSAAAQPIDVGASWPDGRIAAAIELGENAASDIAMAETIAAWFGASLVLMHVVTEIAAPAWLAGDLSANERARVEDAQRRLNALVNAARRPVDTSTRVLRGRIAGAIHSAIATERAALVITALHDRRGWFGARRGSVSYHLLSHAAAPVLACPPRWRPR